jgi:hemin uptake protein HemP
VTGTIPQQVKGLDNEKNTDIVTFFAHWPNGELTLSSTQNLYGDLKRIIMHRGHVFFLVVIICLLY